MANSQKSKNHRNQRTTEIKEPKKCKEPQKSKNQRNQRTTECSVLLLFML